MGRPIVNRSTKDYQLVSIAIDLVHKVLGIKDCNPDLANNTHVAKACLLAERWNELFIQHYVAKEGDLS